MTMTEDETGRSGAPTSVTVATRGFARRRLRARLRRWRPFLLIGVLVVVAAIAVWLVLFSSVLTVRTVDVAGNQAVPTARIKAVAEVPQGEQLVHVDLAAIQARVESIPAVASAAVSRSWPHTISIDVTERTPVAVVERGSTLQAVDSAGVLFGRYGKAPAGLPVVRTAADVKASALVEVTKVIRSLRADVASRVQRIEVVSADDITLTLRGGVTVQWGSAESSEEKAAVLTVLLRRPDVTMVDVSVPGRPTTR